MDDAPVDEPDPIYGTRRTIYLEPAEFARYVWTYHAELFTSEELDVHRWRHRIVKEAAFPLKTPDDIEAHGIASEDWPGFSARAITRIRNDHPTDLQVARCAKCGRVLITPLAKQCTWCPHDWH